MKIRAIVPVLSLAAALAAPLEAQPKVVVQKLADGVWAARPEKGANVGWFLLGDGVVAVDSGADAATAREILKQIAETTGGKPVRAVVLTHAHGDHSGGARAFAAVGARVVCQAAVAGQILGSITRAATEPDDPVAGQPGVRPVLEAVSERSILLDGVRNVQIRFLGTAHTSGDLVVYLVGEKILFGGDLALNGLQPYMESRDVDPAGWERVLQSPREAAGREARPGSRRDRADHGPADLARVRQQRSRGGPEDHRQPARRRLARRPDSRSGEFDRERVADPGAHRQPQGFGQGAPRPGRSQGDARRHAGADPREEVRR